MEIDNNSSPHESSFSRREEQARKSDIKIEQESFSQKDVPLEGEERATEAAATDYSRRQFLKTVSITAAGTAVAGAGVHSLAAQVVDRHDVVAALGDTLIPSDPGAPGYKDLEPYKITEEVMKALPGVSDADLGLFNERAKEQLSGKTFLELHEAQRAQYLQLIIDGTAVSDAKVLQVLRRVYRNTRRRVLMLYYSNFPEHEWPSDENTGIPKLKEGDLHQITNPNTKEVFTGWDRVGYRGPLTWEEEERRRNIAKKMHWHENWNPFDYQPELL